MKKYDISDLIGIPYKERGRDKNGYDCYGLCIEVMRRMGYTLNDVEYDSHYLSLSDTHKATLNVHPIDNINEGAIIEIQSGDELHIGVAINENEMIHATYTQGVRISPCRAYNIRGIYGIDSRI